MYKVNLEAMTQTRMWDGKAGNKRPLKRVTMIEIEGSQPTKDLPDGCDVCWQYKRNWGWKNFGPIPNADVLRAQGEGKSSIVVTHVWQHYKHDGPWIEEYEVDFESMMQTAKRDNKRSEWCASLPSLTRRVGSLWVSFSRLSANSRSHGADLRRTLRRVLTAPTCCVRFA